MTIDNVIKNLIFEGKPSWVRYVDCMDKNKGLPSLPDKCFDLCLADPPFNVKFKGTSQKGKDSEYYKDSMTPNEYREWCRLWFHQIQRISKYQVIFVGNTNMNMWIRDIEPPRDMAIWFKPNCQGRGSAYYLSRYEPILLYGKFKRLLHESVLIENVKTGINREMPFPHLHPCPGSLKLYMRIIRELEPTSVIDPFMGSGTTAEACIRNGVKYYGYEKNKDYKLDIDNRIMIGTRSNEKGQQKIEDYLGGG